MLRCLLLLLLALASSAFADVDSLKGTTNTFDCFLLSTETGANRDTLNYGATDGSVIGWNNSNQCYGNYLFGARCSTLVADILELGHTIDSIRVRLENYTTSSANVALKAYRAPSNWIEGTGNGTASPTNGASMKYKGTGTAWSGETASGEWTGYATQTDDDFNLSGYTDFGIVASDPVTTMLNTGYYYWNVTDQFQDSFTVGQYDVSILFADTVHTTLGSHERLGIYTSEQATASRQPTVFFYHSLHVEPDSSFMRVAVTIPSGSVTDLPVLVNWLTYPANASTRFTVYASDSTTKLYWCLDSLAGHYTRIWTIGDWGASDTLFISTDYNPSYQNCDSVFLLYDDFSLTTSCSYPVTDDFSEWNAVWVDTAAPFLTFYEGVGDDDESDSLYRENSRFIYDWQESDATKRYKWFYTGQQTRPDPGRYSGNWLHWASAPTFEGTWTKQGYLLDALLDTINVEDFNITWSSYWSRWFAICENHNYPNSAVDYGLGMYSADSLDGVWTFLKDVLADSSIGWPSGWLSREQASPAVYVNSTGDSAWCVFEAFSVGHPDAANSRVGMMISFNNPATGDSVFYDWYLTDSTGAINTSNPMPIIRTDMVGQPDRYSTIPNFLTREAGGNWFMSNHGAGPLCFEYYGQPLNAAGLLMQLPVDSSVITDDWGWDPLSNSWIGAVGRDTFTKSGQDTVSNRSAVMRMRMMHFDSTLWANPKWTPHFRGTRATSYSHYKTGTVEASGGILIVYPIQYMETGVAALVSSADLTPPFVVEMKMMETTPGFLDQYDLCISLGDDTLQSYTGGQTDLAAWNEAGTQRGFRLKVNPTATRFRKDSVGIADQSIGSTIAMPTDSIGEMRVWRIYHTSQDSLIFTIDNVSKIRAKNPEVAYTSTPKKLVIGQSEEAWLNRGGVFRADWVRVRKFTTAEGAAQASDTLEYSSSSSLNDGVYWKKHLKWWNGGW